MKSNLISKRMIIIPLLLIVLILTVISTAVFVHKSSAMVDPAAAYCQACGYNYSVEETEYGEEGFCILPNNEKVDAWDFLTGKVALEWSYCAINGYGAKHVEDPDTCMDCCVCILPDNSEVEVTQLMNMSFNETTCGDGVCGLPENYETCPQDCPSGSADGYCDGIADGKCDPDCGIGEDPDCKGPSSALNWPLIGGSIGAVVVIGVVIISLMIRKRSASRKSSPKAV